MFYNYKNGQVFIDGSGIYAKEAAIAVQANVNPNYLADNKYTNDYRAVDGMGGMMSISYYLTGVDPLKNYISNETKAISGNFGGLYFNSGYLKNYNVSCGPNKSVVVNAGIVFFDSLKGTYTPNSQTPQNIEVLNFSDVRIVDPTNGNIGNISGIIDFNFNFNSQINPVYYAGEPAPNRISFGVKEISAIVSTDNLSGDLPLTGKVAGVTFNFTHPHIPSLSENLTISGILFQRNISTSVGEIVKSDLSIKQNYVDKPPIITSISQTSVAPGDFFIVNGIYFTTAKRVLFRSASANFTVLSDTQISGTVPPEASSGPITVETFAGTYTTTGSTPVNYNPYLISGILPPTGLISGSIQISGNNFYEVTQVYFNTGITGIFNVVSPNIINVRIPEFASYGPIKVVSTGRNLTGTSSQNFVPVPRVISFTPISGLSGDTIVITGRGFSGVTGVLFNNLPNTSPYTASFSVLTPTSISAVVPSGNVKGRIKILGQSGVFGLSTGDFRPIVKITGLSPTGARTGDAIDILGFNFHPDLVYGVGSTVLVNFGGGNISGYFTRINSNRLTGIVPYGAASGPVYLYDTNLLPYPYTGNFRLQYYPPTITSVNPQSGFFSGYAQITGTNFFNITGVKLIGPTGTLNITPVPSGSALGNTLAIQYPRTTGGYYSVVVQNALASVTGNSLIYILQAPVISGFSPVSGGIGELITVTGLNLYPNSNIYIGNTGVPAFVKSGSPVAAYNSLQFYIPPAITGSYQNVIIRNDVTSVTGISGFRFINPSTISGFYPVSGTFGDRVNLAGSFLNNVTNVYLGTGTPVTVFTGINNTGLTFIIPEGASSNSITVSGHGTSYTYTGVFQVIDPFITFSGFTPLSGRWGDVLTISGARLNTVFSVDYTGTNQIITGYNTGFYSSGTTGIYATIPNGATGGYIQLRNSRGSVLSSLPLTIIPQSYISTFTSAGAFNDVIQISGQNLTNMAILFRSNKSGQFVSGLEQFITSSTGITVKVPREIVTGPFIFSGQGIMQSTSGNFIPTPQITGFGPTTVQTGNTLIISGINAGDILTGFVFVTGNGNIQNIVSGNYTISYAGLTGNGVTDNRTGNSIISFTVNNDFIGTGYLVLVPAAYSGVVSGVSSLLSSNYASQIFRAASGNISITQAAPTLIDFYPTRGNQNTLVQISGDSLLRTTGVYLISGSTRSQCTLLNSGQNLISFNPPSSYGQRSGQFQVFTQFGNATTTNWFTYIDNLYISGFFPVHGPTGTQFQISGSGIRDVTGVSFDVYPSISYPLAFTTGLIGTVYVVSGTVPFINEGLHRQATITIRSEAGSFSSSSQFTIRHSDTQIHGNLSGTKSIFATGLVVINSGSRTGDITFSVNVESGNYYALNGYFGGIKYRFASFKFQ